VCVCVCACVRACACVCVFSRIHMNCADVVECSKLKVLFDI